MKANHNGEKGTPAICSLFPTVQRYENESKSQLSSAAKSFTDSCFQRFKDTKMKANHNTQRNIE